MAEIKIYKLQWPIRTSDPKPKVLVYSCNKYGEREELGEEYQMDATPELKRLFKRSVGRYFVRIYVSAKVTKGNIIFLGCVLKGLWQ